MKRLISAVQYRDRILLFYDNGDIYTMIYDNVNEQFRFFKQGEYPT